jgi:hypothetical protein
MATAQEIQQAIAVAFAESDRKAVYASLTGCSVPEKLRVQLAILVLAEGDLAAVERLVADANTDYRDILFWAEYPVEAGTGTKRQMARRYQRLGVAVPQDLR